MFHAKYNSRINVSDKDIKKLIYTELNRVYLPYIWQNVLRKLISIENIKK